MHRHITIAGVLLVLLALCSRSADGCICTTPGQPSRARQLSEAVFTGKVVDFNQDNGTEVLVVYSAWKGVSPWKNRVEVGMDFSDCFYELKLGQEYLLYAGKGEGQKLVTNTCYPNRLLAEAGKDLDELGQSKWKLRHHRR